MYITRTRIFLNICSIKRFKCNGSTILRTFTQSLENPRVTVEQGTLVGGLASTYTGTKYYSFQGIPYAKPPIGALRFREPQEPESWNGVRKATKPGNRSAQISRSKPYGFDGSEDCLYLNIYTPYLTPNSIQKLPVVFYIHGGNMTFGYSEYYQPDYFIDHNVIVVTINYRLGAFGFLALDIPEVPGNAGLKDAVLALKWVNKNVTKFGGDKNNITVMGESAGGAIVSSFLTTHLAEGLFHKAIVASGTSMLELFKQDKHIEKAKELVKKLNRSIEDTKEMYEFLMTVPMEQITQAVFLIENQRNEIKAQFLPVIEKKFNNVVQYFKEDPYISFKENRFVKVPMLCGVNNYEGVMFFKQDKDGNIMFKKDLEYFLPRLLHSQDNPDLLMKMRERLKDYYFGNKAISMETKIEYTHIFTDAQLLREMYMFYDLIAKYNENLFCYVFNYSGNLNRRVTQVLGVKGATHGDIIPYQFYRKSNKDKISEADQKVITFITQAWINFIKKGKPSWSDQKVEWLPYNEDQGLNLNIDTELTISEYPSRKRLEFWKDLLKPYLES